MRFLVVTHFFASHGGGIERVAGHLCRELSAAGHVVEWAASASDPVPTDPGVRALPLACIDPAEALTGLPMPIPGPSALVALMRAIRRADTVIVHDALYVTSIVALLTARIRRKPVILVQHIAELPFASPIMRAIMRIATALVTRPMLQAADAVVFISDTVRQTFLDVRTRRTPQLLFNGVDTAVFHPRSSADERTRVRQSHNLPSTGSLVVFVGRFVKKKGLDVLHQAAAQRPDIMFAFAGSGPIEPKTWRLANVHVLGALGPDDIGSLMRAADALMLPSVGEGYPLVVQEALACGLPVICGEETARADPLAARWLHGIPIDHQNPSATAAAALIEFNGRSPSPEARAEMAGYAAGAYSWAGMTEALIRTSGQLT